MRAENCWGFGVLVVIEVIGVGELGLDGLGSLVFKGGDSFGVGSR
jgi:hypothetical protein